MTENWDEPADYLKQLGEAGEGPHDIARAALMLSALDHARTPRGPYEAHLDEIAEAARNDAKVILTPADAARALSALMVGRYGYDGDRYAYDDMQNADLMAVIDRRRGLPVALGILYMHAARAAGCVAEGLGTPGHFLLRLSLRGGEILIDPFNGGAALERESLDSPPAIGGVPDGDTRHAETVSDIDVLLRLQNNIKLRALRANDHARALEIAKRMALIAPRRSELWIELAHLYEASGSLGAAKGAYEACLALAGQGTTLHNEAALGLHALKRRLN